MGKPEPGDSGGVGKLSPSEAQHDRDLTPSDKFLPFDIPRLHARHLAMRHTEHSMSALVLATLRGAMAGGTAVNGVAVWHWLRYQPRQAYHGLPTSGQAVQFSPDAQEHCFSEDSETVAPLTEFKRSNRATPPK